VIRKLLFLTQPCSTFRQVAALIVRENKFSPAALESLSAQLYSNAQNQAQSFPEVLQLERRWHGALLQVCALLFYARFIRVIPVSNCITAGRNSERISATG
jgi:hypothetical protein